MLEGPDGQPFDFKLTYPSGTSNYEKMVIFLKDSYACAGIGLSPMPLEWAVFTDRLKNKNFEAISLGWTSGIETDIFQMFDSSQTIEGGDNFMTYKNPELDKVISDARKTIDEEKRWNCGTGRTGFCMRISPTRSCFSERNCALWTAESRTFS